MQFEDAVKEARRRWGSQGIVRTTVTHQTNSDTGEQIELVRTVGYLTGDGALNAVGEGSSFELAFKDADLADQYIRSLRPKAKPRR